MVFTSKTGGRITGNATELAKMASDNEMIHDGQCRTRVT
jgi:hypothetical protein